MGGAASVAGVAPLSLSPVPMLPCTRSPSFTVPHTRYPVPCPHASLHGSPHSLPCPLFPRRCAPAIRPYPVPCSHAGVHLQSSLVLGCATACNLHTLYVVPVQGMSPVCTRGMPPLVAGIDPPRPSQACVTVAHASRLAQAGSLPVLRKPPQYTMLELEEAAPSWPRWRTRHRALRSSAAAGRAAARSCRKYEMAGRRADWA